MRLIDADTVVTIQVYDDMTEETDTKRMSIADAIDEWSDEGCPPTVDAVEVVRCKDCQHYWKNNPSDDVPACLASPKDDAFCSEGKRREDERN